MGLKARKPEQPERHPNREVLIIDCAYTMVEFMGWGMKGWRDEEVQSAAMAGATVFVDALEHRLPDKMPDPMWRSADSA